MRFRELNALLPILAERGIHTQVVTSAVRPIPLEWATLRRLQIACRSMACSPSTTSAASRRPTIASSSTSTGTGSPCTAPSPGSRCSGDGYLEEFVRFWSENARRETIWISLYTPQVGEQSAERLDARRSRAVVATLPRLAIALPKMQMPQTLIDALADPPAVARRVHLRADDRVRLGGLRDAKSRRASSAAPPTARSAGASRRPVSPRLAATGCPAGCGSARSSTRRSPSVDRCEPFEKPCPPPPSRRRPRKRLPPEPDHSARRASRSGRPGPLWSRGPPDWLGLLYFSRLMKWLARTTRTVRAAAKFTKGLVEHRASTARPNHSHPPLQHRLRLLQRVRQGVAAGADRGDAPADRQARRARDLGRRLQRRRADAASRSRRAHWPHPRHTG